MKYNCVIVLVVALINTLLAGAQDRLHTADALWYARSQRLQLVLNTVLGDNNSPCDGAFICENESRGFRLDLNKSTIILTEYYIRNEGTNWHLVNSKSYSVVVDRSVSSRLSWLYNLAVSTSSPQNPPAVLDGDPFLFVFENMIADWNCEGSDSLIELSKRICAAVENNDPAAINALKESIEGLTHDYKKFAILEDVHEKNDVNHIGVGSLFGPFSVGVGGDPYTDVSKYKSTVVELAGFLLEKSTHPFHFDITVTKDSEWFHASKSFVNIGISKRDFSLEKLKSLSQGWLWAPDK